MMLCSASTLYLTADAENYRLRPHGSSRTRWPADQLRPQFRAASGPSCSSRQSEARDGSDGKSSPMRALAHTWPTLIPVTGNGGLDSAPPAAFN
eukprot:4379676-Prymnesium_polylepis.1